MEGHEPRAEAYNFSPSTRKYCKCCKHLLTDYGKLMHGLLNKVCTSNGFSTSNQGFHSEQRISHSSLTSIVQLKSPRMESYEPKGSGAARLLHSPLHAYSRLRRQLHKRDKLIDHHSPRVLKTESSSGRSVLRALVVNWMLSTAEIAKTMLSDLMRRPSETLTVRIYMHSITILRAKERSIKVHIPFLILNR